ncbi:MAG TPA: hypothetical protein VKB02_13620 [Pyrinomonadaceae bacterium]|nr:hypothetical protein [Pyrinomonadaceae bacterium]
MSRINKALLAVILLWSCVPVTAQDPKPLTNQEFVQLLYQLPRSPETRDDLIEQLRRRGIGFPLTDGMRSLVSTKSGNDALLRRTLEEAERRRVNPTASTLPSETEGRELLERTRNVTLAAANAMPDFLVKQIIKRSLAYGNTGNWIQQDNLTLAVGYRANAGEEYKVLTVDGMPVAEDVKASRDYSKYIPKGASSHGEYVTALVSIFRPESRAEFRVVDTDVIRNRRTVVYEFMIKTEFSNYAIGEPGAEIVVGCRGRVWIDRELDRVLRIERIATDIPAGFFLTAATSVVDYDWVTINERKYLLPSQSLLLMTTVNPQRVIQTRNDIRFRNYQKFGAELKVVDEVGEEDDPPVKPPKP